MFTLYSGNEYIISCLYYDITFNKDAFHRIQVDVSSRPTKLLNWNLFFFCITLETLLTSILFLLSKIFVYLAPLQVATVKLGIDVCKTYNKMYDICYVYSWYQVHSLYHQQPLVTSFTSPCWVTMLQMRRFKI